MRAKGSTGKPTCSKARAVLDRVRELLAIHLCGPLCGFCGGARPYNIHERCPLCDGKPVNAENLLRAIREVVSPTRQPLTHETVRRGAPRGPGELEAAAPTGGLTP